ncbi:MAG TPA: hypothetical protein VGK65_10550, partial [Candidatus Binatia bacterium]
NSRSVAKKALGHLRWSLTYRPNPGRLSCLRRRRKPLRVPSSLFHGLHHPLRRRCIDLRSSIGNLEPMKQSFIGVTLALFFVFGTFGTEAHRTQVNAKEAAEEDAASEEREEKALRSSVAPKRSRARQKKNTRNFQSVWIIVARSLDGSRSVSSIHSLSPAPVSVHLHSVLQVFRI